MRRHDRSEEGEDKNHGTGGRTQGQREDYMEEIEVLMEKNDNLIKQIRIFMGSPTLVEEDEEPKEIRPEDYIIIDGTDSEADSSDDDYVDEAGADIMESTTEEYF